jgi:hypothetical protein
MLHSTDPVPALAAPDVVSANPGDVRLVWAGLSVAGFTGAVQRRTDTSGWSDLAMVTPDAAGRLDFTDRSALPGIGYAYRLQWSTARVASTSAEQWVQVPRLNFAIAFTNTSPSQNGVRVAFSLPDAQPTQIALYDLAGRELLRREVGSMGPGDHTLDLAARGTLGPGVYLVRIRRANQSIVTRTSVLR